MIGWHTEVFSTRRDLYKYIKGFTAGAIWKRFHSEEGVHTWLADECYQEVADNDSISGDTWGHKD
jgi:viroplasmin and RNaseH domain-containing protein